MIDSKQAKDTPGQHTASSSAVLDDNMDGKGNGNGNGEADEDGDDDSGSKRIRLFPESHAGPYIVFVRQAQKPLRPINHSVYVNKNYKSTVSAEHSREKMKFVLNDRLEANNLIEDKAFSEYRVFIKADEVEIDGVINYDDLCDIESLEDLILFGKGILANSNVNVRIIDFHRFTSKISNFEVASKDIKVTFEGRVLPTHIVMYGLRIRVRPWFQRAMFCDKCQHFQHTSKFCTRKTKCAKCFGEHLTSDCSTVGIDHTMCPYCKTIHEAGKNKCTYFQKVNRDFFKVQKARQANPVVPTSVPMAPSSSSNAEFPPLGLSNPSGTSPTQASQLEISNMFEHLPEEEMGESIPLSDKPKRPRRLPFANPWAAGSHRVQPVPASRIRMPAKRKADECSPEHKPNPTHVTSRPGPSQHATPPGFQRSTNPIASIATDMIIKISTTLGLSEHWMSIIKIVAPMIIDAVLSFVSSSSSASTARNA